MGPWERGAAAAGPACSHSSLLIVCLWPGRWTFGDGDQVIGQFKPPYSESFRVPDPAVAQVLVEHNVTHAYAIPGERWGPPPCRGDSPLLPSLGWWPGALNRVKEWCPGH